MRKIALLLFALPALHACGSGEDNKVTTTEMGDLDSVEGTISDDMINTDKSTDEAPVEAAPPPEAKAKPKEDAPQKMPGEPKAQSDTAKAAPAKTAEPE